MQISKKRNIVIITTILLIIVGIILLNLKQQKNISNPSNNYPEMDTSMNVGETGFLKDGQTIEKVNPQAVQDPVRPIDEDVPVDIFHTSGIVLAINDSNLVIRGLGTNFDDQIKRDLTIYLTSSTKIDGESIDLNSLDKYIKIGDNILTESSYNIHGKTEFFVKYINLIK
jgi:hypothetical protein